MARKASGTKDGSAANLGFEARLWQAADALRNNMDAAEYKHVVLGLIFLVQQTIGGGGLKSADRLVTTGVVFSRHDIPEEMAACPRRHCLGRWG